MLYIYLDIFKLLVRNTRYTIFYDEILALASFYGQTNIIDYAITMGAKDYSRAIRDAKDDDIKNYIVGFTKKGKKKNQARK